MSNRHVLMCVWNSFLTDARVTKEAETLIGQGAQVSVFAVYVKGQTAFEETTKGGIRVRRFQKRPFFFIDFPLRAARWLWRRVSGQQPIDSSAAVSRSPAVPARPRGIQRIVSRVAAVSAMARMSYAAWRENADVYHAHDANTLHILWPAARLRGKPIIYDAHEISTDREGYGRWGKAVWYLEKWLTPKVDGMITTTDMRADHFVDAYNCPRPLVLQNRPRHAPPPEKRMLRSRLGIQQDRFVVLYQGGLQPGRGLRNLVRLANRVPEADFVFIGGGRQAGELETLVDEYQLRPRVHFVPTVPLHDLPAYTADADVGVQVLRNTCLNHWTTDSNKLFEYIMAGVPVIASNFPEIRKVVSSGPYGLLVDPDDLGDIEAALRRMIEDEGFRLACRERCVRDAATWSWEAQEEILVDLYQRVLER